MRFKNELPFITSLATTTTTTTTATTTTTTATTTTALNAVENKIPNVSNLVKKTNYKTKVSETENKITTDHDHDKDITIQLFNKLTAENFTATLAKANLASKSDIAKFVKNTDLNTNELNELSKNV